MATNHREEALRYAAQHQQAHLDELIEFLKIPSVSTQPARRDEVREAAEWLAHAMQDAGLENARLIDTAGHPLVYGDWLHAGDEAPTVLVYGHYDVQPAEPEDEWRTPPFAPHIYGDFLIARGVSDDKGQIYIHVKAIEAYLQGAGSLPVNIKFIVEGEEEIGGPSLSEFVPQHRELLQADVAVISDSSMTAPDQPSIVYGLRGLCYMFVDVSGPDHDLHSGSFGGGIDNPINVLCHIVANLKDKHGRVLIPGFYDDVLPLDEEERELLAAVAVDEDRILETTGAPAIWGEREYSLLERLVARPTLDVNGIVGGYTSAGSKTIIPAAAHAKISMRLVSDQDPEKIAQLFEEYVMQLAPPTVEVTITRDGMASPSINDFNTTAVAAASAAYGEVFGKEPLMRREGGSIPVVGDFQKHLGLGTVMMGFGLPDDRIHSPNERFYLPNYFRGIETMICFVDDFARRQ